MNIYAEKGDKVVFSNPSAGYDSDQAHAAKHLSINQVYTVERTEVSDWKSIVCLQEIPDKYFNSVLFDDEKQHPEDRT